MSRVQWPCARSRRCAAQRGAQQRKALRCHRARRELGHMGSQRCRCVSSPVPARVCHRLLLFLSSIVLVLSTEKTPVWFFQEENVMGVVCGGAQDVSHGGRGVIWPQLSANAAACNTQITTTRS
eukprot:360901-Rhodomonas_salina.1